MLGHHPAKFGDHRYCGSGDMIFLSGCRERFHMPWLKSAILFISIAHGMPCCHTQNLRIQTTYFAGVSIEGLTILVAHVYKNN